ncbi:hypothetical protein [Corynebacterium ulcerans]|uniref:Uncharacterized protein n=1 Tax=Corynebacterium ulcerans TaxID=65058 RepID=A0ABD7MPZ6_CORUL|nr:hypothetical protein [Corynebacterium ulcerans]QQU24956.1 hypothetical protein I6I75_06615 [Corynebacterium ulcerans]SNV07020.1 Uncharacterised protein [Corynebacterium ulcerans]SQG49878.1 Uncharacterised protein [Corynebacterium ulcerans]SQH03484.1 Uncharacterised protein [Corynebacterium ulcerans]
MKFTASPKTSTKRTTIALTCALATTASALVVPPAANAANATTSRFEGEYCSGIEQSLVSVTPSWSSFKKPQAGDTLTYQLSVTNVSFKDGTVRLGVTAGAHPNIDGEYNDKGELFFKGPDQSEPELIKPGETATGTYLYTLTDSDIEQQSVSKKFDIPFTEETALTPSCRGIIEHTQNLNSPLPSLRTYAPWIAGALAIIGAAAGAIWFFFKDQLPQLFR